MTPFEAFIARKKVEWGEKFDASDLDQRFVPYFNERRRIKVRFFGTVTKQGTVGVTTGWRPVFLLLLTKRSTGSSWTLGPREEIVA